MSDELTPIRQQYLEIKRRYPEAIVFFRLGDFYETFDQDAEITSRELDIVLTSRNVAKNNRIPMAGIPYHAVDNYLARLIDKGYHVAICEQIGDQPVNGLVPRQVVRVVTPGTVMEPGLLQSPINNYLVTFIIEDEKAGIAIVDVTTGEFAVTEISGKDISSLVFAELVRLKPAEVVLPENIHFHRTIPGHITNLPRYRFEFNRSKEALLRQFGVSTLDGFGLNNKPTAIRAAGAIVQYLLETQPDALRLLNKISTYSTSEFMVLDAETRRNLELTETIRRSDNKGSLVGILDQTITPMGHRMFYQWITKPLLIIAEIQSRQDAVGAFINHGLLRTELRAALKGLPDLERLTNRLITGSAIPRDLVSIRGFLRKMPSLIKLFEDSHAIFQPITSGLTSCHSELELIESAIPEEPPATLQTSGVIKSGFSSELDNILNSTKHAREWIKNLENEERQRTGIKNLKVGYNKVYGYYIEVTRSNTDHVPDEYIRKQTLVNAERYITPELKEYETLVLNAEDRIKEIESRIFQEIVSTIAGSAEMLLTSSRKVAFLDVVSSLAEVAVQGNYVRPEIYEDTVLEIQDGRHPVVEHYLRGERFVPNDSVFEPGEIIRILTGPNMSGKSTFLRQVALIVLMAQIGSYVPAGKARIGLVDRIFTRIGAQDEIHAGQSTFMVEMIETANILNHASNRSLIILDEIGRGTSTYDGVSIAWAVVEYIHNHPKLRARTLFATHYHELTQLGELLPGVRNYNVAVTEDGEKVVFLHKIVPGGADRSYGIHVAQIAGLPAPVIHRSYEILMQLQISSGKALEINPGSAQQMILFPETNPLIEELKSLDLNNFSPIEAINKLFEWQNKFVEKKNQAG